MANILHINQNVMDALKTIGLNLYERKLWVALLSKGNATAGELADLSNVPRSRCYDVLESLADKGFVIIQPSKPMRYVAIKPKEALERAKRRLYQRTEEMIKRIENIQSSEIIRELENIYNEGIRIMKPEDFSGALRGRESFYEHLEELLSKAKRSVSLLTTEQGLIDIYQRYNRLLQRAAKNGVTIRILAPITERTADIVKEFSKYAKIKDVSGLEKKQPISRACSIDGKHFLISLTNDEKTKPSEDIGFWATSEHAASEFFEPVFELLWKHGKNV
jgi:sugar-specific transcriptional regulator TrmB